MGKRQRFAQEVFVKCHRKSWGATDLCYELRNIGMPNVSRPAVEGWFLGTKKIPRRAVPYLAELLDGLPNTWEAVNTDPRFGEQDWPRGGMPVQIAKPDPMTAIINTIDKLRKDVETKSMAIERESIRVLGTLDKRHVLISTTTAVKNYLWYREDEWNGNDFRNLLSGRVQSIKADALFLMLVPSKSYFTKLQTHLETRPIFANHEELLTRYSEYRQRAIHKLGENGESIFDSHQQCLEIDDFPFTGAGWTVSLLCGNTGENQLQRNSFIHGPYSNGLSLQLWRQHNDVFADRLYSWMWKIVDRETNLLRDQGQKSDRLTFFERLQGRMLV
jgi:hypothetical protein